MKHTFLLLTVTIAFLSMSCKQVTAEEVCDMPHGLYVNTTFLSHCGETKYASAPFTFLEMNFRDNQTVTLDNGVEKYNLPVMKTENGCQFKISNPSLFGELYFTVKGDNMIQLFDSSTTKLDGPSLFEKRIDDTGEALSFDYLINDCVLAGEYLLYKKGIQQSSYITIMPNGQLNGLKPYLGYELCFGRACLGNNQNTLYLIDQTGQKETFSFKKTDGKNFIEVYSIAEKSDDSSPEQESSPMVFELRLK